MQRGEAKKNDHLMFKRWLICAFTSSFTESVTQPFDLAKTRLQLQNTANVMNGVKTPSRGLWRTMTGVVREEGFWALFGGVGPAALRQVIYGGICTGFYKPLRRLMYPGEENQNLSFPKRLCVSLTTGITGQTCSLPLDLIKVRMQADGRLIMMGEKPRYKNATDAFFTIIREEGISAFFTGVSPTLIRAGLLTVGGIACYDSSKEWIMRHFHTSDSTAMGRVINCTLASIYSGFVSTCMSNPFDVVKTRMMEQHQDHPLYKSSFDCFIKTVRYEGVLALTKGFGATMCRMAPWQFIFYQLGEFLSMTFLGETLTN